MRQKLIKEKLKEVQERNEDKLNAIKENKKTIKNQFQTKIDQIHEKDLAYQERRRMGSSQVSGR